MLDDEIRGQLREAAREGQSRPGVVGVDYGFVYVDGKVSSERGIRFHVRKKRALDKLSSRELLPEQIGNTRCDVVQASYSLQSSARGKCDPIQPGVSVGNLSRIRTGTLGLLVQDRFTERVGILSNWHVLCGTRSSSAGDEICQPGPDHAGTTPPRIIAALERWLDLDSGCDAAFALLNDGVAVDSTVFDSQIAVTGGDLPSLGMHVVKFGVSSGLTHGLIDGLGGSYQLDYSSYEDTKRWIDGLRIVVHPDFPQDEISLTGDSGAAWVEPATGKAVALHFAGEDGLGPTAEYALALDLPRVLRLLDLDFPPP